MTTFTNVPKEVEQLLEEGNGAISRRNFLKGSGLLVVSVGAAAIAHANPLDAAPGAEAGAMAQGPVRIPTRTSSNSIRGSSFTRTARRPSMSGRPTVARALARRCGR